MALYAVGSGETRSKNRGNTRETQNLAKILLKTHRQFDEFLPKWELFLDCYQGIGMSRRLKKHIRESEESLKIRKGRMYYLNYCEPVIDLYIHYIFSKPAIRKVDKAAEGVSNYSKSQKPRSEIHAKVNIIEDSGVTQDSSDQVKGDWDKWLKNVDRRGNDIDRFMSHAGRFALALGHAHVLVDMPSIPEKESDLATEQQRTDKGVNPYATFYYPQDMINFAIDEFGELLWCRMREKEPPQTDPFKAPERGKNLGEHFTDSMTIGLKNLIGDKKAIYLKTWTRENWTLHKITSDEGAIQIGGGTHPCKKVPVVQIYNNRFARFDFYGRSLIFDIALINIAILNWSSLIDEEIYQKCLNILCIGRQQGNMDSDIIFGSNNTLEYEGSAPFFLAPATDPGAFIQQQIDRMRDEIFRIAKLGGGLGLEVASQRSGVAHAFEFNETNRTVAEKADEIEIAENLIHKFYHAWLGKEWNGLVDYPDSFSVESMDTEINLAQQAKSTVMSPTFHREMDKKVVKKVLHNVPEDILEAIMKEINDNPTQAEQQEQEPTDSTNQGKPKDPNNPDPSSKKAAATGTPPATKR